MSYMITCRVSLIRSCARDESMTGTFGSEVPRHPLPLPDVLLTCNPEITYACYDMLRHVVYVAIPDSQGSCLSADFTHL